MMEVAPTFVSRHWATEKVIPTEITEFVMLAAAEISAMHRAKVFMLFSPVGAFSFASKYSVCE